MPNASDQEYYWGTVLDALACVYLYQNAGTDDFEYQVRYKQFPDAINHARVAYHYCEPLPRVTFGMIGEDIDIFFSNLLIDGDRLDQCYSKALDNRCSGAPVVPIRLL